MSIRGIIREMKDTAYFVFEFGRVFFTGLVLSNVCPPSEDNRAIGESLANHYNK